MVAPLIGAAAAAAAKLVAKKLAKEAAKKVAKKAVAKGSVKKATPVPPKMTGQTIKINTNPSKSVVKPVMVTPKKLSPSAEKSIADIRKALGTSKPDPKELARRLAREKALEAARIRKQGRNTR